MSLVDEALNKVEIKRINEKFDVLLAHFGLRGDWVDRKASFGRPSEYVITDEKKSVFTQMENSVTKLKGPIEIHNREAEEMCFKFTMALAEDKENKLKQKLIDMGWTPPKEKE